MTKKTHTTERPPVVAIMGHVDHGKSSLLDYIRKSNIVAGEAGGITQHISAYEVHHTDPHGDIKRITFIDTPGHAAFSHMRNRGATIADIAILIVSSEEGVKAQTIEAIKTIEQNKVPYIVALTKIDRPHVNIERVKSELMENGVFVEGYGGDIPCIPISAISGIGIPELLETILLLAEFSEFIGDPTTLATGFIIEAHMDAKRGVSATLIIKNGSMTTGQFIATDNSLANTRLMENGLGKNITHATFSTPVCITGFSELPHIGTMFQVLETKKDAEEYIRLAQEITDETTASRQVLGEDTLVIPIIIKTDVYGIAEAISAEIEKLSIPEVYFKIIKTGVGTIGESDMQLALSDKQSIIIGFNVDIDPKIRDMNGASDITIGTHSIIYKITEWLEKIRTERKPMKNIDEVTSSTKILKVFSTQKGTVVAGGRVNTGTLNIKSEVKFIREEEIIGRGKITSLQQGKAPSQNVESGNEFGMAIETNVQVLEGDIMESFITVLK